MTRPIGIDLGTTNTVVATLEERRPRIIPNAEGEHLTPSVVAFDRNGNPLVGRLARMRAAANPDRTVLSIKRHMGTGYTATINDVVYTPQEISSLILRKVKADAENYLGEKVERAVITVPAYFNDLQRQATREAGVLAGLEVMRIINEPTAAALAYGIDREDVQRIMVWDLGGGTFDVSILELDEGIFEVRAVSGDASLGGDDIDHRLMDYLAGEYRKIRGLDFPSHGEAWQSLRQAAENAKIHLSFLEHVPVRIPLDGIEEGEYLEVVLTRPDLDLVARDTLQRMIGPAQQALSDAGLASSNIDRVVLVGGATRMPAVRQLVREVTGREPYRYVDPDETVAMGAAIQAGMLLGLIDKAVLLDVLPLSLGVETQGGLTSKVVHRNTPLPVSESLVYTSALDDQTSMDIHVLQGERELARDNISLGQFSLEGLPGARRGTARVEVNFDVDLDGMVNVSAKELASEAEMGVRISATKLLDGHEISDHAANAKRRTGQDRTAREAIEARIAAQNMAAAAVSVMLEDAARLSDLQRQQITRLSTKLRNALPDGNTETLKANTGELRKLTAAIKKSLDENSWAPSHNPAHPA